MIYLGLNMQSLCHSGVLLRVPVGYFSSYLGFLLSKYLYLLRGSVFIYYGGVSVFDYIVQMMLSSYIGYMWDCTCSHCITVVYYLEFLLAIIVVTQGSYCLSEDIYLGGMQLQCSTVCAIVVWYLGFLLAIIIATQCSSRLNKSLLRSSYLNSGIQTATIVQKK